MIFQRKLETVMKVLKYSYDNNLYFTNTIASKGKWTIPLVLSCTCDSKRSGLYLSAWLLCGRAAELKHTCNYVKSNCTTVYTRTPSVLVVKSKIVLCIWGAGNYIYINNPMPKMWLWADNLLYLDPTTTREASGLTFWVD